MFITGGAGTGKYFLVKVLVEWIRIYMAYFWTEYHFSLWTTGASA